MRAPWHSPLHRWIALALLISQALVVSAPFWHHHDCGDDDGNCAVCVAVTSSHRAAAPTTPGPVLLLPEQLVGILVLDDQADSSSLVTRCAMARGPPAFSS